MLLILLSHTSRLSTAMLLQCSGTNNTTVASLPQGMKQRSSALETEMRTLSDVCSPMRNANCFAKCTRIFLLHKIQERSPNHVVYPCRKPNISWFAHDEEALIFPSLRGAFNLDPLTASLRSFHDDRGPLIADTQAGSIVTGFDAATERL